MHLIPIEVVPSHVHLSAEDYAELFGDAPATVAQRISQAEQYATDCVVEVRGKLFKRAVSVRYVGPERVATQVELTPTEAKYLGIRAPVVRSGDGNEAGDCILVGPAGKKTCKRVVIVPRAHLHCSPGEASQLRIAHGQEVRVTLQLAVPRTLESVLARVHPSFSLRLHVHADIAREHWISGSPYAALDSPHSL